MTTVTNDREPDWLSDCCPDLLRMRNRLAAELGAKTAAGPASLRVSLLDSLYQLAEGVKGDDGRQQLLAGLKIARHE